MNFGILYICTGKYERFFEDFYSSAKKFLLPGVNKTFFVWTDEPGKDKFQHEDVIAFEQKKLGWPFDTLYRYKLFYEKRQDLKICDSLMFFNANMKFIDYVGQEICPKNDLSNLCSVFHPSYMGRAADTLPYERNPKSQFYVEKDDGQHYYQCCVVGGETHTFLTMCKELDDKIAIDVGNGIIPRVWDESAFNHHVLNKKINALPPTYAHPEAIARNGSERIIQLDKSFYGGHDFLRS